MPWTMTLESLVSQIAMSVTPRSCELGGPLGRTVHGVHPLRRAGCSRRRGSRRPSSALLPSRRTTSGLVTVSPRCSSRASAWMMPLATASQAVMPPKTLTKTLFTAGSDEHDLQPVRHHLGARAAADVEEVGRLDAAVPLAGVRDHVEGGHDQARAVADDADLAVELDVVEVLGLGGLLQRVDRGLVHRAPRGRGAGTPAFSSRVTLASRQQHPAVAVLGERVDLDQRGVLGDERLPQLRPRCRRPGRRPRPGSRPRSTISRALASSTPLHGVDRRPWRPCPGSRAATCSISMPPATLAMQRKVRFARSSR